jgi:uncharacterized membrane protein (DUF485 family)
MSYDVTDLRALARQRLRVGLLLSGCVVFVYFGFILLIAFNKPLMGRLLYPGLSLGILLGAVVIVLTWGLTWYYMRWANTHWAQVSPPSAGGAM